MDMEKTGTYLASLRRGRDMTQQQVADILGVSNKTVSKWESGAGLPDIAALPALAALYGVTADDILAGETRPRACADTPAEVEAYLERRGSLRFRIGYSLAVMALAVWVAFPYNNWSWLCLLASPLCLWLGWGVCRSRETLRRRILLLIPLCALWLFAAIQLLGVWRLLVSDYALHGGVVRQFSWAALTVRQEAVWLLLPLLLAAALVVGGAVLKEPLVRDRGFRFALYGGCGLLFAVEIVRILVCWKPAAAYAATVSTAESVMSSRYADLSAVAWPLETVRWIVLAAVVAAWLVWGMQAYRHAKKN